LDDINEADGDRGGEEARKGGVKGFKRAESYWEVTWRSRISE